MNARAYMLLHGMGGCQHLLHKRQIPITMHFSRRAAVVRQSHQIVDKSGQSRQSSRPHPTLNTNPHIALHCQVGSDEARYNLGVLSLTGVCTDLDYARVSRDTS